MCYFSDLDEIRKWKLKCLALQKENANLKKELTILKAAQSFDQPPNSPPPAKDGSFHGPPIKVKNPTNTRIFTQSTSTVSSSTNETHQRYGNKNRVRLDDTYAIRLLKNEITPNPTPRDFSNTGGLSLKDWLLMAQFQTIQINAVILNSVTYI